MFERFGVMYYIFMVLIVLVEVADIVNIVMVVKNLNTDRKEYCKYGIKWSRILMNIGCCAAIIFFIVTLKITGVALWINIIIVSSMVIVSVMNVIFKIKMGRFK